MNISSPIQLRCEHLDSPSGIDLTRPRLSWILSDVPVNQRSAHQAASRILVASTTKLLAQDIGDLWDSDRVNSSQSVLVEYAGKPLASWSACHWKVRVWDQNGECSPWSVPAKWRMGAMRLVDWKAQWIRFPAESLEEIIAQGLCPWFRKTFVLDEVPTDAVASISSIGYHELYINGRKVSDAVLTPSVSDLRKRALYLTHEIGAYLQAGENVVAIWLAPGWSDFSDINPPVDFHLKEKPLCLVQINLGEKIGAIVTDESWLCAPSNTSHLGRWQNGDFGGDRVDATMEVDGWNKAGFDDSTWQKAVVARETQWELSPDLIEPNRLCEKIAATQMSKVTEGKYRFVMAKLYAGWIEVRVRGRRGSRVTIKASSRADREVEFNQQNEYIIGPSGEGVFCNRFTYHECGFVTIDDLEQEPELTDVVGYRVTNDRERIGGFDCSNKLLKKIYDITANTYVNLCTGGMTVDCPHRERLGYGGDAHASLELALDTFASAAFMSKWAQDWCDIQDEDGRINHTAPTLGGGGGPAWSGIIVTMPWEVYLSYGDVRILEKTYPFTKKWLAHLAAHIGKDELLAPLTPGRWAYMDDGAWLFLGDWVAPGRHEWSKSEEALFFNNCYYLHTLRLAARIADLVGEMEDARAFVIQVEKLTKAINRRFLDANTKTYLDGKQSRCVMPLIAGAVPEENIQSVQEKLEHEILVAHKGHLDTGMHGTYFMTKYLTEHDRSDLIFAYASKTTYPSYGDLIAKGYESWPELWKDAESPLHGCLNGIGGWFQRGLAGIRSDPSAPGYKKIIIKPALVGDLKWVNAHHDSPYGRIVSNWRCDGNTFTLEVRIPPNTTATIYLPTDQQKPLQDSVGVKFIGQDERGLIVEVESGNYSFTSAYLET